MKILVWIQTFLCLASLCGACSAQVKSDVRTVYDTDNRISPSDAGAEIASFTPTVALLSQRHRSPTPSNLRITAPQLGPVFGLCSDEPFFKEKTLGDCTGFLIEPKLLLTAGHCVKGEDACANRSIIFNFNSPVQQEIKSSDLYFCKSIPARLPAAEGDLALIELDRDVTLDHGQRFLEPQIDIHNEAKHIRILGHSFGVSLKVSALESTPQPDGHFFFARADVSGGASGSPAFDPTTGALVGVLIGGESDLQWDHNAACNRNKVCNGNSCKGERFASVKTVRKLLETYQSTHR
jgi:hypothetical protein